MSSHGHKHRPHAILIPMVVPGHWIPMSSLLFRLVEHGISCTVVSSPSVLSELQDLKLKGVLGNVDVELIEGFSNTPNSPAHIMTMELRDQFYERPRAMERLIARRSSFSGPTFMMVDILLPWTKEIAEKLGVPRYVFSIFSCFVLSLIVQLQSVVAQGWYATNPDRSKLDETINLPGLEFIRGRDIPDDCYQARDFYDRHGKLDGFVINSCEQIEGVAFSSFRTLLSSTVTDGKVPSVYAIGPLAQFPDPSMGLQQAEDSKCLQFLHSQRVASVMYICFGSLFQPTSVALTELARALELTSVPFLWILPKSQKNTEFLPAGFASRTEGRGLVWSGWVNQPAILKHPSVDMFLSHCGWNSSQDTIFAGLPIIAWPIFSDQAMISRFLVGELKVAVPIFENVDDEVVGEEIAKAIRLLVDNETGKPFKVRMQELKKKATAAMAEGGSSYTNFRKFVEEVSNERLA